MGRTQAHIHVPKQAAPAHSEPQAPDVDGRVTGAFNATLLAIMGRRRMVVLAGSPSERLDVLVRLARHLEVDGALVLPAGGRADVAVEHLIRAAAHVTFPPGQLPPRFDTLIDHLADLLENMGTGVLLVDDADRLGAATLSDLVELSGTQSETGRFLQIVLAGPDALMRRMGEDERNLFSGIAVAVPMTPAVAQEAPASTPVAAPPTEPPRAAEWSNQQGCRPLRASPARTEPQATAHSETPAAPAGRGDAVAIPPAITAPPPIHSHPDRPRLQAPLPRLRPPAPGQRPAIGAPGRRRTLWVASAGIAAMALAVTLAAAPRWVGDAADRTTETVAELIEHVRSMRPADVVAADTARTVPVASAPAAPHATAAAPAKIINPAAQPSLPAPAAAPPKAKPSAAEFAAGPPPSLPQIPTAERPNLPVEALSMREPPPLDTSAALPKPEPAPRSEVAAQAAPVTLATPDRTAPRDTPMLRDAQAPRATEPPTSTPRIPVNPPPQEVAVGRADLHPAAPVAQSGSSSPAPTAVAPALGEPRHTPAAVTALVNQARRQIDDRRLTTPIGDNALETVRAMEAAAAAGVEPARLRAAIVDSYLRLGALAEQRGQFPLARIYYRRAQQAVPDHEKIGARLEAVESRLEEGRGEPRSDARQGELAAPPAMPSDAPKLR